MTYRAKFVLLATTMLLSSQIARAQEADAQVASNGTVAGGDGAPAEILVTARKRSERLIEVPATIDVFTAEDLAPAGNVTLNDLASKLPNFFITSPRMTRISATMRGLGVPGVGLYIDGVYQPSEVAFAIPLFDLAQVEVLKGPQGTLYGRNAFSGAISYVTRAPSNHFEGEVNGEVGNAGTVRGSATVAGPIVQDLISARVSGSIQRRTGFRNFADGSNADRDNFDAFTGRVMITPASNLLLDVKYTYVSKVGPSFLYYQVSEVNDARGNLRLTPVFGVATGELAGSRPQSTLKSHGISGKVTYSASAFDVISTTAYTDLKYSDTFDADLRSDDFFVARGRGGLRDFSQELRAQSTGGGAFKWLVGAYYDKGANNDCSSCGNVLGGTALGSRSIRQLNPPVFFEAFAFFTDLEYKINDHFVFGVGARYDELSQKLRLATGASTRGGFHGFQPKLTARYLFTADTQIYASATKGFTQGGFNTALAGTGSPLATYPNQQLWQYEAGFKSSFDDRRGNVSLAAFYIDASSFNAAATVPTPLGPRVIISPVGKIKSYGLEVDTSYRVSNALTIDASGGYNKVYPTSLSANVAPGVGNVDEQLQRAPKWTYRAAATYTHAMKGDAAVEVNTAISGVGPTRFCGESALFGPCSLRKAYSLVDGSISIVWPRYRVSLFSRNLFDKTYASDFLARSALAQFGAPSAGAVYGDARYWGIRASAKF